MLVMCSICVCAFLHMCNVCMYMCLFVSVQTPAYALKSPDIDSHPPSSLSVGAGPPSKKEAPAPPVIPPLTPTFTPGIDKPAVRHTHFLFCAVLHVCYIVVCVHVRNETVKSNVCNFMLFRSFHCFVIHCRQSLQPHPLPHPLLLRLEKPPQLPLQVPNNPLKA